MRTRFAFPLLPLAAIPALLLAFTFAHAEPRIWVRSLEIEAGGANEQQEFACNRTLVSQAGQWVVRPLADPAAAGEAPEHS